MTGSLNPLGADLAALLANQLTNDPQIQLAAKNFAQHDVTSLSGSNTGETKNWPIYNWIDNYVIKLNPQPLVHP